MNLELPPNFYYHLQAAISQGIEDGFSNAKTQQQAGWRSCIDHIIKPDSPCPVCALAEANIRIGELAAQLTAATACADAFPKMLDEWAEWEAKQFPQATTQSRLKHLRKEVDELLTDQSDLIEYVDCFALLMLAARHEGIGIFELLVGMQSKLKINKARKWGLVNSDGFVEHIREQTP